MDLNTGALAGGGYLTESPDALGALAKGAALGADLQNIVDKQAEARQKKQVISNLPTLMGRIKENQNDFDAVSQVAQYAPGMIEYINAANRQDAEVAEKRKSELVNNLAGAYAFISSADQRGQSKEQAWQDVMKWNQAHGIDMGDLANEEYSDAGLARMKGLVLGTKALAENAGGQFSKTLQVAKDAEGNLVYVQPSEKGGAQVISGLTPVEGLITVNTGGGTEIIGGKTGKTQRTIEKTLTPSEKLEADIGFQGALAAAKEEAKTRGEATGKQQASQITQAANAATTLDLLNEAEKIIPKATGSLLGQGRDIAVGALGGSTKEAQNLARLRIIGAKLVQMVPRMEGPQSDADVKGYKAAAGDFANPSTPWPEKMAALQTMRALNQKYAAQNTSTSVNKGRAQTVSTKAQYDALPSGAVYLAPDGTQRRKK